MKTPARPIALLCAALSALLVFSCHDDKPSGGSTPSPTPDGMYYAFDGTPVRIGSAAAYRMQGMHCLVLSPLQGLTAIEQFEAVPHLKAAVADALLGCGIVLPTPDATASTTTDWLIECLTGTDHLSICSHDPAGSVAGTIRFTAEASRLCVAFDLRLAGGEMLEGLAAGEYLDHLLPEPEPEPAAENYFAWQGSRTELRSVAVEVTPTMEYVYLSPASGLTRPEQFAENYLLLSCGTDADGRTIDVLTETQTLYSFHDATGTTALQIDPFHEPEVAAGRMLLRIDPRSCTACASFEFVDGQGEVLEGRYEGRYAPAGE